MKKMINFTKLRFPMLVLSFVLIVGSWVGSGLNGWFNLGIDFSSGLNVQVEISSQDANETTVREALNSFDGAAQVQNLGSGDNGQFIVILGVVGDEEEFFSSAENNLVSNLEKQFGNGSVSVLSSSFVGARFASDLAKDTTILTLIALLLIVAYIWVRFKLNYAISAITAIVHDVLFLVGFIGVFKLEVSTATVAAVLTIIGYSLNDTIVIFDRIRENTRILKENNFEEIVNTSINQSLSRTLITSFTTLIAVVAIYIFSTGTIQTFALNLIVGIIVGTYSSIFIASTLLIAWHKGELNKIHKTVNATATHKSEASVAAKKNQPELVKQSAEEIAEATAIKKKSKEKKKKKK